MAVSTIKMPSQTKPLSKNLAANSAVAYLFGANARFLVVVTGATQELIVGRSTSDALTYTKLINPSGISVSASGLTLTISNTASTAKVVDVILLDGTAS